MSDPVPLRLGVWCAALRDGFVLLSKRSDLNVWALPGGRPDAGESLMEAASREVEEETGAQVTDLRPAGLYYMAGWRRLNILFTGTALRGDLLGRTNETRDNRFFPLTALPPMPLGQPAHDVAAGQMDMMRILETGRGQRLRLRARFGLRYVQNALRGRPEPAFPHFSLTAVALVTTPDGARLLTLPGETGAAGQHRALPRLALSGASAPWDALAAHLATQGIRAALRWAGVWHDAHANALELVFTGQAAETGRGEWATARTVALHGRDADYLQWAGETAPWYASESG